MTAEIGGRWPSQENIDLSKCVKTKMLDDFKITSPSSPFERLGALSFSFKVLYYHLVAVVLKYNTSS